MNQESAENTRSDSQKTVTVVLSICSEKENVLEKIGYWLRQQHQDYDVLLVDDAEESSPVLNKLLRRNQNLSLINAADFSLGEFVENAKTDYICFADAVDFYPRNYLTDMTKTASETGAEITVSGLAVLYPEKKDDLEHGSALFVPVPFDGAVSYLQNNGRFWGTYFLGNKLFRTEFLQKNLSLIIRAADIPDIRSNTYFYHFALGEILLLDAKNVALCSSAAVIANWVGYDDKVRDNTGMILQSFHRLQDVLALVTGKAEAEDFDKDSLSVIRNTFVRRLWWRTAWALDGGAKRDTEKWIHEAVMDEPIFYEHDFSECGCEIKDLSISLDDYFPASTGDEDVKIHIYVTMHAQPSYVPENRYLLPMQIGAALSDSRFPDMLHDDEGENISEKRRRYCELTAMYWAWKNDAEADYYGFFHYRRYLCFQLDLKPDSAGVVRIPTLNDKYIEEIGLTEEKIREAVGNYDLILPQDWPCDEGDGLMTVYEQWCRHLNPKDMQVLIQVICEKYPNYAEDVTEFLFSTAGPFCNLFIMSRELFLEYCDFCFTVLEETERRVDHSEYNTEMYRTAAHLAERLFGIYVRHLERINSEISILRLPTVLIQNTQPYAHIEPIQTDKRRVAVALACNATFAPYTSVLLESIAQHASEDYFYDIVLMYNEAQEIFPDEDKDNLRMIFENKKNISLRFADVTRNFEKYSDLHVDRHLSLETYYRFMIPDIMPDYERALYMDCDMIAEKDVAELFFTDMEGNAIAAVRDFDFIASCHKPNTKQLYDEKIMKYIGFKDEKEYFQAGVILFDLNEVRALYSVDDMFERALSRDWFYHDQDVLNSLFHGHVLYLDTKWNVFSLLEPESNRSDLLVKYLRRDYAEAYRAARKDMGLIHFAGVPKPWMNENCDLSAYFWKYAKKSPYYEQILKEFLVSPLMQNIGYSGSVVFPNEKKQNVGCGLFEIVKPNSPWTECYAVIDFIFLGDHHRKEIAKSSLFLCASTIVNEKDEPVLRVNLFRFDNADYVNVFQDNITYQIVDSHTIRINARQPGQFEGFAWKVRQLTTRDLEKVKIKVLHDGFVRNPEILV